MWDACNQHVARAALISSTPRLPCCRLRRPQWQLSEDVHGQAMMRLVRETLGLRRAYGAIRRGGANILHEDRQNGVVAFERVAEGEARIVCVINASRGFWQKGNYGVWVGGGEFEQVYCSQVSAAEGSQLGECCCAGRLVVAEGKALTRVLCAPHTCPHRPRSCWASPAP